MLFKLENKVIVGYTISFFNVSLREGTSEEVFRRATIKVKD